MGSAVVSSTPLKCSLSVSTVKAPYHARGMQCTVPLLARVGEGVSTDLSAETHGEISGSVMDETSLSYAA